MRIRCFSSSGVQDTPSVTSTCWGIDLDSSSAISVDGDRDMSSGEKTNRSTGSVRERKSEEELEMEKAAPMKEMMGRDGNR